MFIFILRFLRLNEKDPEVLFYFAGIVLENFSFDPNPIRYEKSETVLVLLHSF